MASLFFPFGQAANVAQLAGVDALKLIALIITAAKNARMHKKNCRQFAQHLKLIGALLEQLQLSELRKRPETSEPLAHLEDALKRALVLVSSCQDKSYLYLLAMGWTIVQQFKECQAEIDKYLKLIPLIALVENNRDRMKAIENIEKDKREYTLDEQELKVQNTILKPERSYSDSITLSRELSRSYPGVPLNQALKKENAKLRAELYQMQAMMATDQVEVIERLIGITEEVDPNAVEEKLKEAEGLPVAAREPEAKKHSKLSEMQQAHIEEGPVIQHRKWETSYVSYEWRHGLFDCWTAPCTCFSTCCYPCGTFTDIAAFISVGEVPKEAACNEFCFYTLFLGCFCYTSCFRRKVRKRYLIPGTICDDFCAHTLCFCCALIQEWREIEFRELKAVKRRSQQLQAPGEEEMSRR